MKKKLEQSVWIKDTSGDKYLIKKGTMFEAVDKKTVISFALPEKLEKIFEREGYKKLVEKLYSQNPSIFDALMEAEEEDFMDQVSKIEPEKLKTPSTVTDPLPGVEEEDVKIENPKPEVLDKSSEVNSDLPGVSVVDEKTLVIPSSQDFDSFLK
jgi:hypothetical protein